jgi:hypothetical protein
MSPTFFVSLTIFFSSTAKHPHKPLRD